MRDPNPRGSKSALTHGPWSFIRSIVFLFVFQVVRSAHRWARFSLPVCKFVMSSVVHHEGRDTKVWFFSKQLGLIDWLSEFMSRKNPSSRSASSPKVENFFCSFLLMLDDQKRPLYMKSPLKSYTTRQKFTSNAETEKYWHLGCHRYR